MEKNLKILYKNRENEIRKEWDSFFEDLKPKWEKAWKAWKEAEEKGDKEKALQAKAKYERIMRKATIADRDFKKSIDKVTEQIAHANETAIAYLNNEVPEIYAVSSNGAVKYIQQKFPIKSGIEVAYRFDLMDASTAKALLTRDIYSPLFKKVNIPKDKRWNRKLIHSQVAQGIFLGEEINKIADRIQNVTDANRASAVRNARTMCTTAENTGRLDRFREEQRHGIILQKEWLATTTDKKTRDSHKELNGKREEIENPFINSDGEIMYPGDPTAKPANVYNCRCTLKAHIIGFRKKNGKVVKIKNFD